MPPTYSETHHLNVDDAGLASVHVAVHLQNVNPQIAHLLVLRVLDAASAVAAVPEQGVPGQVIRPQTSGPCVHYDERSEHVADTDPCTYPYGDGTCPHLDNSDILCPVKDACYAMSEVARMRDECKTGQDLAPRSDCVLAPREPPAEIKGPGVAPVDVSEPETKPAPKRGRPGVREWTPEQERAMCGATTPAEAVALYRATFPDSERSDASIKTRYHLKIRPQRGATPAPDFAGDTVPVTQCDEAAIRRPRFKAGDRVRISHPAFKGYTGTIRRYYAATANYLTHIDGTTDTMWLSEEYLEAA